MELLINEMLKLGGAKPCRPRFSAVARSHNFTTMNVGERNTEFVEQYLQTERTSVSGEQSGHSPPQGGVLSRYRWCLSRSSAHAHPETLVAQEALRGVMPPP